MGVVLFVLAGCEAEPGGSPRAPSYLPPPAPSGFVVFSEPALRIGELGVPVPAPVTVGSTPSPATLESDRPDVVGVTPSGQLVAYQAGRARVRAITSGESIEVEVAPGPTASAASAHR